MAEDTFEKWKPHDGAGMPVDGMDTVQVKYRDGITSAAWKAGDLRWEHNGNNDDVLEYKVLK